LLIWAAFGKSFRWGLYVFDGDSDLVLDRRTGRVVAAIIGVALILAAFLYRWQE
jgi:hypothetical protein